jgi:Ser/Thr protein kinase RdoA (MazF antagonist)
MSIDLYRIAEQFSSAKPLKIEPLGNGLINETYKVTTTDAIFVLQALNQRVFKQPEQIVHNHRQLQPAFAGSDCPLHLPALIPTSDNRFLLTAQDQSCWRAMAYIQNSHSLESLTHPSMAAKIGRALGQFHRLSASLNPELFFDTLPGFHITPDYLQAFDQVCQNQQNDSDASDCYDFILSYRAQANVLEQAKQQGVLVTRLIHGDPKLNNFLLDRETGDIISLIDLDTVKPGLVHYDIGDCLRSCCHRTDEDQFDLATLRYFMPAYLTEAGDFFNSADFDFLYAAIELIPFELGLRFFTDYLAGNVYFKVTHADQNLHRARSQFRLCQSIQAQKMSIQEFLQALKP